MKVTAGDLPNLDGYAVGLGSITYLFKSWMINNDTVDSVQLVQEGRETNHAGAAQGAFVGTMFFGPIGTVAGGLLGARKQDKVLFLIQFKDGTKAVCWGTTKEFNSVFSDSMKNRKGKKKK